MNEDSKIGGKWLDLIVYLYRIFRFGGPLRHPLIILKNRMNWPVVGAIHAMYIHELRRMCLEMAGTKAGYNKTTRAKMTKLANECRDTMAKAIDFAPKEQMHCTIKFLHGKAEQRYAEWEVFTVARSKSNHMRRRTPVYGRKSMYKVGENSTFAALMGCNDGEKSWDSVPAFVGNDLYAASQFQCRKEDWRDSFRSVAVFQINLVTKDENQPTVIGFVTFDTLRKNAFFPMPDIFELEGDKDKYLSKLWNSTGYHAGGIIADTLAIAFSHVITPANVQSNLADNAKNTKK